MDEDEIAAFHFYFKLLGNVLRQAWFIVVFDVRL